MKYRKVEILRDGVWVEVDSFKAMKMGDKFRLTEPDDGLPGGGELVSRDGQTEFTALCDPKLVINNHGEEVYGVDTD